MLGSNTFQSWSHLLSIVLFLLAECMAAWSGQEERFITLSEYDSARASYSDVDGSPLEPSMVLVLVMASRGLEDRVRLIEEAWADSPLRRLYLVDDWLDCVPRSLQWRPAAAEVAHDDSASSGDSSVAGGNTAAHEGAVPDGYWTAQSRQLEFMHVHAKLSALGADIRWVILADDDTFVNADQLVTFASRHDPQVPVLFTYVLSDAHVLGYDYPCGGAGMLLSASAYETVASYVLTRECPLLSFNDLTLGFCVHKFGIPMVHSHNFKCAPDLNRAMRSGENLLDIQRGIGVHRLPGFRSFVDLVAAMNTMEGQLRGLLDHGCKFAATMMATDALDSRRLYWTADAFPDAVRACREGELRVSTSGPLHLDFVFFAKGVPVARYHRDRVTPRITQPHERAARWPDWMEQLRHLDCAGHADTWHAKWLDILPRISRRKFLASDLDDLASGADVSRPALEASFAELERASPRGSWLDELKEVMRKSDGKAGAAKPKGGGTTPPGRRWVFLSFHPTTTFVNVFESVTKLRALSNLYAGGGSGEAGSFYQEDIYTVVNLGGSSPPPVALAYEYLDVNVEQDSGVWLNGVALNRLMRCPTMAHPIALDPEAHLNDWESEERRLALLWHNVLAVDIFRTLRFCGVMMLHAQQMVPHALSYLPYSTYWRVNAPAVATSITIGNVMAREQMFSMAQLVWRRACRWRRLQKEAEAADKALPQAWKPPFKMRAVGGCSDLQLSDRQWHVPGARFLGLSLVAFRSEHFLPDAQAVASGPPV